MWIDWQNAARPTATNCVERRKNPLSHVNELKKGFVRENVFVPTMIFQSLPFLSNQFTSKFNRMWVLYKICILHGWLKLGSVSLTKQMLISQNSEEVHNICLSKAHDRCKYCNICYLCSYQSLCKWIFK